jgi:hypothetical protein
MLWLVAVVAALDLAALAIARVLARTGRAPSWVLTAAALAAGISTAIALWSVHVLRDGFAASAEASASERSSLLASEIAHSIDVALVALVIAAVNLAALVAVAIGRRKPGRPATAVDPEP